MGIDGIRRRWREEFNEDGEERIDKGRKEGRMRGRECQFRLFKCDSGPRIQFKR